MTQQEWIDKFIEKAREWASLDPASRQDAGAASGWARGMSELVAGNPALQTPAFLDALETLALRAQDPKIRETGFTALVRLAREIPEYAYPRALAAAKQAAVTGGAHEFARAGLALMDFMSRDLSGSEEGGEIIAAAMGSPDAQKRDMARMEMKIYAALGYGGDWDKKLSPAFRAAAAQGNVPKPEADAMEQEVAAAFAARPPRPAA